MSSENSDLEDGEMKEPKIKKKATSNLLDLIQKPN